MTFTPYIPGVNILVEVTLHEAHLIKILRAVEYGHVTIFKANKQSIRVESNKSIILNEKEGRELEYRGKQ